MRLATAAPVPRLLGSTGEPLASEHVRIHAGPAAAASAAAMNARAYTYGQDIVFGAGEWGGGLSPLLEHELAHARRQRDPAMWSLAFQKQPAAPAKFYTEVEDALDKVPVPGFPDPARAALVNLLALSEAVEAQDRAKVDALAKAVADGPAPTTVPYVRSEAFVHELLTRMHLMGAATAAGPVRAFFSAIRRSPMVRREQDRQFDADKKLWAELGARIAAAATFANPEQATASIDTIMAHQRVLMAEARSQDFGRIAQERKGGILRGDTTHLQMGMGITDTASSYLDELLGQMTALFTPLMRAVQVLMDAAVADLEASRGSAKLAALTSLLTDKIRPLVEQPIGPAGAAQFLGERVVDVTRSTFGPTGGTHHDMFDRTKSGVARDVTINFFSKGDTGSEMELPVLRVVNKRIAQAKLLADLYENTANRTAMGAAPMKLDSVDGWRTFLRAKLAELLVDSTKAEALGAIITLLGRYLDSFAIQTTFNIDDLVTEDRDNYIKRTFPRALTGQAIHDCGVFALRIIYMLSLVGDDLKLRFRFVQLPNHVGLVITGKGLPTFIAHGNQISEIPAKELAKEETAWLKANPGKVGGDAFIGALAGAYFAPGVDMPFRLVDLPATFQSDDLHRKELLQKAYGALKTPVGEGKGADDAEFASEYSKLAARARHIHNRVLVPAWNVRARQLWSEYRPMFEQALALTGKARADAYAGVSKAYLAKLDTTFEGVDTALDSLDKERDRVTEMVRTRSDLTAADATPSRARTLVRPDQWRAELDAHRSNVQDPSDVDTAGKLDAIAPPFAAPAKGAADKGTLKLQY